jgi:hypothetical protein
MEIKRKLFLSSNLSLQCDVSNEFTYNIPLTLPYFDDVNLMDESVNFNNFLDNTNIRFDPHEKEGIKFKIIDKCIEESPVKIDPRLLIFNSISVGKIHYKPIGFKIFKQYNRINGQTFDLELIFLMKSFSHKNISQIHHTPPTLRFSIFFKLSDNNNSKAISDEFFENILYSITHPNSSIDIFAYSPISYYFNKNTNLVLTNFGFHNLDKKCEINTSDLVWLASYNVLPISKKNLEKIQNILDLLDLPSNKKNINYANISQIKFYKNHEKYIHHNLFEVNHPKYKINLDDDMLRTNIFHFNSKFDRVIPYEEYYGKILKKIKCPDGYVPHNIKIIKNSFHSDGLGNNFELPTSKTQTEHLHDKYKHSDNSNPHIKNEKHHQLEIKNNSLNNSIIHYHNVTNESSHLHHSGHKPNNNKLIHSNHTHHTNNTKIHKQKNKTKNTNKSIHDEHHHLINSTEHSHKNHNKSIVNHTSHHNDSNTNHHDKNAKLKKNNSTMHNTSLLNHTYQNKTIHLTNHSEGINHSVHNKNIRVNISHHDLYHHNKSHQNKESDTDHNDKEKKAESNHPEFDHHKSQKQSHTGAHQHKANFTGPSPTNKSHLAEETNYNKLNSKDKSNSDYFKNDLDVGHNHDHKAILNISNHNAEKKESHSINNKNNLNEGESHHKLNKDSVLNDIQKVKPNDEPSSSDENAKNPLSKSFDENDNTDFNSLKLDKVEFNNTKKDDKPKKQNLDSMHQVHKPTVMTLKSSKTEINSNTTVSNKNIKLKKTTSLSKTNSKTGIPKIIKNQKISYLDNGDFLMDDTEIILDPEN